MGSFPDSLTSICGGYLDTLALFWMAPLVTFYWLDSLLTDGHSRFMSMRILWGRAIPNLPVSWAIP